ncbi:MAG: hypothetical protein LBV74_23045 [Tannerella sp.]|jgi:hypothetical protein|nr:hypothetical protein [Tannerella sp.]
MEEIKEGINIHLPENYHGEPVEVIVRHGEAVNLLDPKEPRSINIKGTIEAPLRWLEKRTSETDQVNQKRCFMLVNREKMSIVLFVDERNMDGEVITGSLEIDPIFTAFGINGEKTWTPVKLGEFFKMNRAYFPDRSVNMSLVSELKNFVAKINSNLEKRLNQNGSKTDNFSMEVNSNLPDAFTLNLPVFRGGVRKEIEVETYATVEGQNVYLSLVSPDAREFVVNECDNAIDTVLEGIKGIAPDIVIIEQ